MGQYGSELAEWIEPLAIQTTISRTFQVQVSCVTMFCDMCRQAALRIRAGTRSIPGILMIIVVYHRVLLVNTTPWGTVTVSCFVGVSRSTSSNT